ncbi:retron Ec48 family effector membrane protein [Rahnella aquatilis]|uniref:retron Ec48 family effector membrane protein n=1 Tax=Rahnella aquatilis TaxID=34038 RepID=UPI00365D9224
MNIFLFLKKYLFLSQIQSVPLRILLLFLYATFIIGILTFGASAILTGTQEGYFKRDFCFNNTCLENAAAGFSQSILIMQAMFILLGIIASVGGIIVALMGYINSVSVSALGNHISHFKIFQEYLSYEINKRDRLSPSSFDIFKWYNIIFNKSRSGSTSVSEEYCTLVLKLNELISKSNTACTKANKGSFSYVSHQINMVSTLAEFGIVQPRLPRNDFYEVEDQIIGLIANINREFCYSTSVPELINRDYR